jgi:hypothetical protein
LPKPPPKPARPSFARPGSRPAAKPGQKPGQKPFARTFSKTGDKPFAKGPAKPGGKTFSKPFARTGDKPFARPGAKPGPKRFGAAKPRPAATRFEGDKGAAKPAFDVTELARDIGALRTYLEAQAGRKWERVYGELRAHVGEDEAAKEQLLTRLEEVIARQVERVPPTTRFPCGLRHAGAGGWSRRLDEGLLYVDPKDGVIKRARARVYAAPAAKG